MPKNPNRLPFEVDVQTDDSLITAHAGVSLVGEMYRASGAAAVTDRLLRTKKKALGLSASEMTESFFYLWAAGGERFEDFENFRTDRALVELINHELPAPQTARDFINSFHKDEPGILWAGEKCKVYRESPRLEALNLVNREVIHHVQTQKPETTATIDLDAVIFENTRSEAEWTYKNVKGYQPVVAMWAEQDLILVDEYRDGNVPARTGNLRILERAIEQLPSWVSSIKFRADSACYEENVMAYLEEQDAQYAISATMSPSLAKTVSDIPEGHWITIQEEGDVLRQWAEVTYVGDTGEDHTKTAACPDRRYLAIRVIKKQGGFFSDGNDRRHFAVVTNIKTDGAEILDWHRKKAGTIEHVHHVVGSGLAGRIIPSKRFGSKAAWFRLNTILYNLLSALRRLTLPEELAHARPKRLRFVLFNTVGKVVRHAREVLLRFSLESARKYFELSRLKLHHNYAT